MNRVIFFIDGFNLYHALDEKVQYRKYKWLKLYKLCNCYVRKIDNIENIYYFTALVTWDQNKVNRHKLYIKVLEHSGIKVIYGAFKQKEKCCRECGKKYKSYEEKQTDINIATQLLVMAFQDKYDTAIIISGDTDLIPAIRAVKTVFSVKKIGIVLPIGRSSEHLKQVADCYYKMNEQQIKSSIFDYEIDIGNNQKLSCPNNWR
ncbi:MAG: NYN domain-containing protein [Candidatus Magnetoovum sp. WYHC-5]|nr:NYN domain-containing protein [Candidatus Magnetoovum sp. WYHC-5]